MSDHYEELAREWLDENGLAYHYHRDERLAALLRRVAEEAQPKTFPIQAERGVRPHPTSVPWSIADLAYSGYSARHGRSQSLETLAGRGGFYPSEMDEFLPDWRDRCSELSAAREQVRRLREVLEHIAVVCCMNQGDEEFWCKRDGSAHSCYCAAGIARAALAETAQLGKIDSIGRREGPALSDAQMQALRESETAQPEEDPIGMGWKKCKHGQWMPPGCCTPDPPAQPEEEKHGNE